MVHIGIVGARKYRDRQSVIDLVRSLPEDAVIVTSLCRGVCTWAGQAAKAAGFKVRLLAPDLTGIQSHGDMVERYYRLNRQLIAACDIIHAFISKEDGFTGGEPSTRSNMPSGWARRLFFIGKAAGCGGCRRRHLSLLRPRRSFRRAG